MHFHHNDNKNNNSIKVKMAIPGVWVDDDKKVMKNHTKDFTLLVNWNSLCEINLFKFTSCVIFICMTIYLKSLDIFTRLHSFAQKIFTSKRSLIGVLFLLSFLFSHVYVWQRKFYKLIFTIIKLFFCVELRQKIFNFLIKFISSPCFSISFIRVE